MACLISSGNLLLVRSYGIAAAAVPYMCRCRAPRRVPIPNLLKVARGHFRQTRRRLAQGDNPRDIQPLFKSVLRRNAFP